MGKGISLGYPSVKTAGFHHCALIYEDINRSAEAFRPMVAKIIDGRPQNQWGFDAFLFLIHFLNRMNTEIGYLRMGDFQTVLDTYFASGIYLDGLNNAIRDISLELGESPPTKRKVMLAIPWLNPEVTDFGDVDNDGNVESLATIDGRKKVLEWYVEQAIRRFENRYPELELWGFYWMRENISESPETVRAASDIIHRHGLKLIWIPYYLAKGYADWRKYGIDVAIMQSNYTFTGFDLCGNVRGNRLDANATLCRRFGLGFEIELAASEEPSPKEQYFLLKTLEKGAAEQHGYQQAPTAYFFGHTFSFAESPKPELRALYSAYCDYLAGKSVAPNRVDVWKAKRENGTFTAVCEFASPTYVANTDVFFSEEIDADHWQGTAQITGLIEGEWYALGWAVRATFACDEQEFQCITIPVNAVVSALKLEMPAANKLNITEIAADHYGKVMDLTEFQSPILNDVRVLNTAVTSGALDAFLVRWGRCEQITGYLLDRLTVCDEVRIRIAVPPARKEDMPCDAALMISEKHRFTAVNGLGALPEDVAVLPAGLDGEYLVFKMPETRQLSRFSCATRINGFSMLGEVSLLLRGEPVAITPQITAFQHRSTVNFGGEYYEDGVVASTGVIPLHLNGWLGWVGDDIRKVALDLGGERRIHRVELEFYCSEPLGAIPPTALQVQFSHDAEIWSEAIPLQIPTTPMDTHILTPLVAYCQLPDSQSARFIKLSMTGSNQMTLLKRLETY